MSMYDELSEALCEMKIFNPVTVMTDYELGLINSFKERFVNVEMRVSKDTNIWAKYKSVMKKIVKCRNDANVKTFTCTSIRPSGQSCRRVRKFFQPN